MRHLSVDQARAALRRGRSVEQLLSSTPVDVRPTVRWLSIAPTRPGEYELRMHLVLDVGSDDFLDVTEFPPVDEENEYVGEGKPFGTFREPNDILGEAHREWGASPDRWVNEGLVGEEYDDRRSAGS